MFILRNIGNFVPPYKNDEDFHGSSAAIAYSVSVLNVKHIIICGHSHCGACACLHKDLSDNEDLVHVRKWLELGHKAKEQALKIVKDKNNIDDLLRTTEKISVIYQLENLLSYPEVYKKVKNGSLEVHGWYYKIEDGSILCYDGDIGDFKKL
jgi:carbonic anhydrase